MTATQAPTPGPLTAAIDMLSEARDFIDRFSDVIDGDYGTSEPNAAMVMVHEINATIDHLSAPTAPVEASGSERDGPEVGEDAVAKILAPYLPTINSTPDLLSILYDADLMPEQTVTVRGAICVAAVCEAYKAALRPQPSGETREKLAEIMQRNMIPNDDGGFSFHDLKAADEILALQQGEVRETIVKTIAFLKRDIDTPRINDTVEDLLVDLVKADAILRGEV